MNRTFGLRAVARWGGTTSRILMHFEDHESFTQCQRCCASEKAYVYIKVLDMYTCPTCYRYWTIWGMPLFKEMINSE